MRLIVSNLLLGCCFVEVAVAQAPPPGPAPRMVPVRTMRMESPPPAFVGNAAQLRMDLSQVMPVVEVKIAGKPYRFAVDTGAAGHGRISPTLAQSLGLAVGDEAMAGDGSGRRQARRTFHLDSIDVGGVRFTGIEVLELSRLPPGVDGILGLGLFASHLLTLDYPSALLSLSRASLPATAMTYTVQPGRGIAVPVSIGGETVTASIDTGNSIGALVVPAGLAERLPRKGEPRVVGRAGTAISTMEIKEIDITVPVRLGGLALPISRITFPSLGESANLGSKAFALTVLRIDQLNRRIEIAPAAATSGVHAASRLPSRRAAPLAKSVQTRAEVEVRRLERAWLDAYEQHDAAAIERIVADEFRITYPHGQVMTKAAIMDQIRSRPASGGPRFSTEEVAANVFGDTVVLTGIFVTEGGRGRQKSRYTDTWVRRGGRWQVVASHLSPLA